MSINQISISGNLARDAELRQTAGGTSVLVFCIAVNERRKNAQSGEWEDCPSFIDCTLFGNLGPAIQGSMSKGTKVAASGKIRHDRWEKDGERKSRIHVIVDDIEVMRRADSTAPAAAYAAPAQAPVTQAPAPAQMSVYDEDIPF